MTALDRPTTTASRPTATAFAVAVVGCGPAGCFTAQALRKRFPDIEITIFDTLPTPYGLIRHGIAPDHQGAKAVYRQFDRLFAQDGVRFVGNTAVGTDLPLTALTKNFHAVVLATGLAKDRPLEVPQDPRARVVGAGALLRLLNSDPDSPLRQAPGGVARLGTDIAIVGTGNVAVDLARLLTKSPAELRSSDIDDVALSTLVPSRISTIHIVGRSDKSRAKWDASMLKELGAVESVELRIDGEQVTAACATAGPTTVIDVHFRQATYAVGVGADRTRLTCHRDGDPTQARHFDVDTVVSAVGFVDDSILTTPVPITPGQTTPAAASTPPLIVRVGGSVTGRLGNLAENRKLAMATVQMVAAQLQAIDTDSEVGRRPGYQGIVGLLPATHTTFEHWTQIDEAETRRATADRCRIKFTSRAELLAAAAITEWPAHPSTPPATIDPNPQGEPDMSSIHIFYGTESGNAEMVADDVAEVLREQGFDTTIAELSDVSVADLTGLNRVVFITSTYGEGELPETAAPFFEALVDERPDLSSLSFGAFGLGDSAYETFNNGIERLRAALTGLGAYQIGETAKHDAASGEPATDLARIWAESLMTSVLV